MPTNNGFPWFLRWCERISSIHSRTHRRVHFLLGEMWLPSPSQYFSRVFGFSLWGPKNGFLLVSLYDPRGTFNKGCSQHFFLERALLKSSLGSQVSMKCVKCLGLSILCTALFLDPSFQTYMLVENPVFRVASFCNAKGINLLLKFIGMPFQSKGYIPHIWSPT